MTEQEDFWRGEFGDEYVARNDVNSIGGRISFFSRALARAAKVNSVYEVGTNVGLNLDAFKILFPEILTNGCEINQLAQQKAVTKGHNVENASVFDAKLASQFDLVVANGILIHINPDQLNQLYDFMERASARYILINEYFSPYPVEVNYRGHSDKLFKRDFAKEIINQCNLKLVDYGFIWRHDPALPGDDTNWFLLEK